MSNYYLCDTCGVYHHDCRCCGHFRCKYSNSSMKKVMSDDHEHPYEVCPYWKPKEDADA